MEYTFVATNTLKRHEPSFQHIYFYIYMFYPNVTRITITGYIKVCRLTYKIGCLVYAPKRRTKTLKRHQIKEISLSLKPPLNNLHLGKKLSQALIIKLLCHLLQYPTELITICNIK